ncbi:MAG TPA: hypothetical protein VK207_09925 [Bacteroidales bacterium]|nr:hypothetical protein [Bacteroidales bacterium]
MRKFACGIFLSLTLLFSCKNSGNPEAQPAEKGNAEEPRIVNIINFVRLLEPRIEQFTEDVLYQTVVEQVKIMRQYKLKGTFLLQYDALMDPRYQQLMKSLPRDTFEIGAWWEIPQPLVENAGMKWRGRYPWDWHANVGFTTGYTPEEREKLADVYMNDFKKIFGYYPESVGCWFIDAHSLDYLYDNYNIKASCMCRDQIGTDGYTIWGGYWNQAYFPSRINSYMPAQTEEKQLPVPVFRMLGSDPVRQYDKGTPPGEQGVITLEPVYRYGGGDSTWVHWFFREFVNGESLEFNYVQAGQENSFTWNRMAKGYKIQMPLIAKLRDENRVTVETLGESGKWFTEKFRTTPATSMTVSRDLDTGNMKTAWFNSRFYRANLLWQDNNLRIRDIHLFDEDLPTFTTTGVLNTTYSEFFTLPFVDGYRWSTKDFTAGMRFKAVIGGKDVLLEGSDPEFTEKTDGTLTISWPLTNIQATLTITLDEKNMSFELSDGKIKWYLDLQTAETAELPFLNITDKRIDCSFQDLEYHVDAEKGSFAKASGNNFRVNPENGLIVLNMAERE